VYEDMKPLALMHKALTGTIMTSDVIAFQGILKTEIVRSLARVPRYGLDGPGIESRCEQNFLQPFKPALWPTQPPIQWVPGLFPGGKAAGAWS
jgi:hypothetical protein